MSNHIEDQLSAYMDNELTETERRQVEEHLDTCPECSELLSDLSVIRTQVFTAFHSIEAPEGFEDKVINAIGLNATPENVSKGSNWLFIPLISVLSFITIALVVMGSYLFKFSSIMLKVAYNLIHVFGDILGSHAYIIAGLIGLSIILIVASSISIKHVLKTSGFKGANW